MNEHPVTVTVTFILIGLNAAIWFLFAILLAFGFIGSIPEVLKWIMVILALGSSVLLIGIVFFLQRHNRIAYFSGLALLALIAVLSVTDDVGLLDVISVLISAAPLALMLKDRDWYLHKPG